MIERKLAQALGIVALFLLAMGYAFHAGGKWNQAKWDKERAELQATARQVSEDYRAMEQAWQAENERITGVYNASIREQQAILEDERARGVDLGRRLLRVSADLASRDRASEVAGSVRAAYASEVSSREAELARLAERGREAVNGADQAALSDSAQLAALIERVK